MKEKFHSTNPLPDFGGHADAGVKHSLRIEVPKDTFDFDTVVSEADLGDAEVDTDAHNVTSLEWCAGVTDYERLSGWNKNRFNHLSAMDIFPDCQSCSHIYMISDILSGPRYSMCRCV